MLDIRNIAYKTFCLHATTEFLHVKPGKGAAFVRTKMRNYITGNTVDKTFRAGSTVIQAETHLSKPVEITLSVSGYKTF